ncbi:MAG: pyridoxamine kinase [Erysipelotrichaceae bacterium]|nr:pyridoxamine kinase [Erysipelotrichaceae bacterium]
MERQKRIALINDITGFGRCSVAAMAPIVSAMKIQAVPIPTAILSTHTQFPIYYFDDYTSRMSDYIQTYKDLNLEFDAIATGFLGSVEQFEIVFDFIETFKNKDSFVLVDPVMGDHGKLYATYTQQMCNEMKKLVHYADLLTPNLTELVTLVDEPYPDHLPSFYELSDMCEKLSDNGPQHIVVTGIPFNDKQILNFIYNRGEDYQIVMVDRIGNDRCGTGDVIASVIAGSYLNGHSFYHSVKKATKFASRCISRCEELEIPNYYGLCFEEYLWELGRDEQ